jgi:TPR repeat protein
MKKQALLAATLLGLLAAPAAAQDAEALYGTACDAGDRDACGVLALMFETGRGIPRDLEKAASRYGQACQLGDMEGCTILGSMYVSGQGVTRDLARAVSLHERACEGGELAGCEALGLMYETGSGVLEDYTHAAQLYRQACDGALPSGCNRIGMLMQNGQGIPANPEGALDLFAQACDGGDWAGCVNLAVGFERGEGVPPDPSQAAELYQSACDAGFTLGCVNLGSLYRGGAGVAADTPLAASLYRRACDAGDALGCYNLGVSYEQGTGVPQDPVTAVAQYQRACEGGLTLGCERLPSQTRQQVEPIDSSVVATFGRVADAESEDPIENAIVDFPELGLRLISDRNGRVDLPDLPVGRHLIRAEAAGYAQTEGFLRVPGEADFLVMLEHALVSDPYAPGRIVGRITDETGSTGVSNVDINLLNRLAGRAVSNQQGRFQIDGIAPGLAEIRFQRIGYEPRTETIIIQPGLTVDVLAKMSTQPIPLEPIQVVAVRSPYLERQGFYDRAITSFGTQFGPAELEALKPLEVTDLFYYVPSVEVEGGRNVGAVGRIVSRRRYGATDAACGMDVYLDGVRMGEGWNVNEIQTLMLEAMEVYSGLNVPTQYQRRSSESGCGIVLIWTKRGA